MYQQAIREALAKNGHLGVNPKHVEAHMRAESGGTLDRFTRKEFDRLAISVIPFVNAMSTEDNDDLALGYGLR